MIFSCEVKYTAKNLFGSETKMLSEIKHFFFCSEKIDVFLLQNEKCEAKGCKNSFGRETKNVMPN